MERRDFLKLAAGAGLALSFPAGIRRAEAASVDYRGPLWVFVNADGGWDPTSLCDPKGRLSADEASPVNKSYGVGDILTAGNIRYAPVGGNQAFFEKHWKRLLVVNGLDTETNSHDSGQRNVWSGSLQEGLPALAALVAGGLGKDKPMAFLSSGGFDDTAGLVALSRAGNMGALSRIAFPNRSDPNNPDSFIHSQSTSERIAKAQEERIQSLLQRERLPRVRRSLSMLVNARAGQDELQRLSEMLPSPLDDSNNPLKRQAQVAVAAYRAGITVSANLNLGGFDTHGNHDATHIPRLQMLLEGVDFLLAEAEDKGIADRIVVAVGSDFGRTPSYNSDNGKDHWSITSMMLIGAGIPGNRVVGATDERHRPLTVDPRTLQLDARGIRLKPVHVHRALRRLAGVDRLDAASRFPLAGEDLPILG
ncbi:DUF1501 domain-containing protein [Vulgatibacter incomptus]|uniref:Tat (Twin-arginine translocation) pathway signal sequence domain protein n=1 Tax=Vulgatibacter incomptus TaxID=1391653 RepID=A0A0K1PER3_9BACT|nr:DUF1501 domain-containing protein [Vulgatibacter incomptus]AKU92005.1 hypothetical protein AKJ08_2392 [Vulgatibacter incomptus]